MYKKAFVFLCVWVSAGNLFGQQAKPNWQVSFPKDVNWYDFTRIGTIVVLNDDGMHGVDPAQKKEIWNLPQFRNLPSSQYKSINNSPYIEIIGFKPEGEPPAPKTKLSLSSLKSMVNNYNAEERSIIIDPLSGIVMFDSKSVEMDIITEKTFLPKIGCVFLEGRKGEDRVMGLVEMATGKTRWIKEKPAKLKKITLQDHINPRIDPEGNIIFRYAGKAYRINAQSGEILWSKPAETLSSIVFSPDKTRFFAYAGGFAVFSLQTGDLVDGKLGTMTAEDFSAKMLKELGKRPTVTAEEVKNYFTGSSARENALFVTGAFGFNFFDYVTLKPLWQNSSSYYPFTVKNVTEQNDGNYIVKLQSPENKLALSISNKNGIAAWAKPVTVKGSTIYFLEYTPLGLVYVTDMEVNILDLQTGKTRMKDNYKLSEELPFMYSYARQQYKMAVYQDDDFHEIDFKNGTYRKLLKKIGFKGGNDGDKIPNRLEARKDGFFLANEQNLLLVGYDGVLKHRKYYNRPGMSDRLRRALVVTGGVAAGRLLRNQITDAGMSMMRYGDADMAETGAAMAVDGAFYGGTLTGAAAGITTNALFDRYQTRTRTAQLNRDTQLVLASLEGGGNGFIKVDKDTGKELSSLRLDDKEPSVEVDNVLGGIFYWPDGKNLYFYDLK